MDARGLSTNLSQMYDVANWGIDHGLIVLK